MTNVYNGRKETTLFSELKIQEKLKYIQLQTLYFNYIKSSSTIHATQIPVATL